MTNLGTVVAAFILGFVPGAGYAYLGRWRLMAANILTAHWFLAGFLLGPPHCVYLAVKDGEGNA